MKQFRRLILSIALSVVPFSGAMAQDIAQIAKSDPLVISGAIGTTNTFYHSTGYQYSSPFQSTIWANLNVSVYGISMPFSLFYSNSDFSFNYPHFSLNLSPTYKEWHGYFGQSSMAFSPYVMNMSFNGVGVEYQGKRLRGGIFYGRLRNAINDNPEDPHARAPQYKRLAWGLKVGYGSNDYYLDLYFLRAYDALSSIDESWRQRVNPQSNLVLGLRGHARITKWLSLTANAATSLFTSDTRAESVPSDKLQRWDKIFDAKYTSNVRFAGDANLNFSLRGINASLSYRIVQPDYTSLGAYYMSNNYQSLGVTAGTHLFRKVSLSGSFSLQSDNLSGKQLFTTKGFVYNANASTRIGKVSLNLRYNGYLQRQYDGMARVNDTTRVNRIMHSIGASAGYSFGEDDLRHSISLSGGWNMNKDLNRFATGMSDVSTNSAGATYSLTVEPWRTDFGASFHHQQSRGYNTRYTSDILTFSAGRSFFEEGNLHVQANLNIIYNKMRHVRENMSLGGDFSAGYTLKQYHTFSLNASVARSNDVNFTGNDEMYNITETQIGLSYTYTFSLLQIKRKIKDETKKKQ